MKQNNGKTEENSVKDGKPVDMKRLVERDLKACIGFLHIIESNPAIIKLVVKEVEKYSERVLEQKRKEEEAMSRQLDFTKEPE